MLETWLVPDDDDRLAAQGHTRPVTARVHHLVRYPVKGLAGIEVAEADLDVGGGLAHDRAVAISNGSATVPADGSWTPPSSLLALARNPGLTRLTVDLAEGSGSPVTVAAPDGSSFVVHLDHRGDRTAELRAAGTRVEAWIPWGPVGPPAVLVSPAPLWNYPDAAVSIVNLATVELLDKAWGTALDPRRFRANLYLEGLRPWDELELVGRCLRVGNAELEVLRPVERGRGAGVDPDDGSTDLDVAQLLRAGVGHRFLGLYARVVGRGRVRRGDRATVLGRTVRSPGPAVAGAPPRADWPRRVGVESVVRESATTLSLWLRDPSGIAPAVRPGQHVRLHTVDADGPFWRKYTVSATEAELVRVSVGLEPGGRMSEHLRACGRQDPGLTLTGPFGEPMVDPDGTAPVLMLSAGIGITPTVALLRKVLAGSPRRPVGVLHVARSADVGLWHEVTSLVARLPAAQSRVWLHLTGMSPQRCRELGARPGRPTAKDVARAVSAMPADGLVTLVCGPERFRSEVRAALRAAGVPDGSILQEAFFSPPPADRARTPPASVGPFQVRFSASGRTAVWEPEAGSLLEVAESCGLTPPVDCRTAVCNVCATAVSTGSTAYTTPPMAPPGDGQVLICSAVPTSDVTVAL